MANNEVDNWLEALKFETGMDFSVYHESDMYTLMCNGKTYVAGLTERECVVAINSIRSYNLEMMEIKKKKK